MALTSVDEVKFAAQLNSEYSDEEIFEEIELTTSELYDKYNLPKRSQFTIDDDYTKFYISKERVHEIIRVRVQVETTVDPSGYIEISSSNSTWQFIPKTNYLTLHSDFISIYDNKIIRVDYIPKTFNMLATNSVAYNLIAVTNIVNGESVQPPLVQRLGNKVTRYKNILKPKGFLSSSKFENYDKYEYISYSQTDLR